MGQVGEGERGEEVASGYFGNVHYFWQWERPAPVL
jgi:hypothetical protein